MRIRLTAPGKKRRDATVELVMDAHGPDEAIHQIVEAIKDGRIIVERENQYWERI
jgi:hypothetical protein